MGGTEQNYINKAFEKNWIAPLGENVTEFETRLENYLGDNSFVAALNSGTAAIHLALLLLGVKENDEVICQSFTFSASANPILYLKAKPIFVDSEKDTWNISPEKLEEAIKDRILRGKKPKAIIIVHLYGMPAKIDELLFISEKYKIPVLEDSAEALGSKYKGKFCGTFGNIAVLSFNGNKIITTSGGGALISKKKETKENAIFLATQARDTAPHYQHSTIGYNYRLSNICAGIGCGQMEFLERNIQLRRKNHQFYQEILPKDKCKILEEPNENYYSNFWLSTILLDSFEKREELRLAFESENIESRPLWKPMHLQPVFSDYPFYGNGISEDLFNRGLCLPSGSNLTEEEKERISSVLKYFFS